MNYLWIFSFLYVLHPHFVSVTKIDYNDEKESLEVTNRIFTDDLERALSYQESGKIDLLNDSLYDTNTRLIQKYLSKHFILHHNDLKLNLNVLGFEKDEEAVIIYSEADCTKPGHVQVYLDLLTEIISTQVNIVHFKVGKQTKSTQLSKSKKETSWSFN